MPFSRNSRTAASMSPFVSCSARLLSIIGAPVRSRSSLTSAAAISAIGGDLLGNRLFALRLFARRDLLGVAFRDCLLLFLLRRRGEVGRRRLLLACLDAVRDHADDQVAGADGVVVARNDVVGL